jgi:hypothetical protein
MNDEMVDWLIIRQHDLVENTIEKLLDGEDLGEASKPWRSIRIPKIMSDIEVAKYFINNYGEKFSKELSRFSNCWKRAAVIIGHALTWNFKLPDKESLPDESKVTDPLNPCDIDHYLLVSNNIPLIFVDALYIPSFMNSFAGVFANEYENAINEVKKLLKIWRGEIRGFEVLYALGLVLIVAEAARLGRDVNEDDISAVLKTANYAVQLAVFPFCVDYILMALRFLRDKAPQQYIVALAKASIIETLYVDMVRSIYDELNYVLSNYFDRLEKLIWPLESAMRVYSNLLLHHGFTEDKVIEDIIKRMFNLLDVLKREDNELAVIAEVYTLYPALANTRARDFMSKYCYIDDLATRAAETLKNLEELANKSDELLKKEYLMDWVETEGFLNVTEEGVRRAIMWLKGVLTFALAKYKLDNGELDEASKLSDEAAEIMKNAEDWRSYFISRNWALRIEVLKARNIDDYVNVASDFEKLWYEAREHFTPVARDLEGTAMFLGNYLIYLASITRYDYIEKTLSEHALIFNYCEDVSILTRLMLRLLGFTKEVAEVKLEELIDAYNDYVSDCLLPALRLALGINANVEECESLKDLDKQLICIDAFLAVKGNNYALEKLRSSLDTELFKLAQGLNGKELVQLLAPKTSASQLAFMLYALVNGNVELAKKHAYWGSKRFPELCGKLFRDAYESCGDISSERFKLALLKLYHLHF